MKSSMILFVACVLISCMCQAKRTDLGRLNENVEILFSKTERDANKPTDIRRELQTRRHITEEVSKILEELISRQDKLELANQALNQKLESAIQTLNHTMLEIQNDNKNTQTELNKLKDTFTSTSTTIQTTTESTSTTPERTTTPTPEHTTTPTTPETTTPFLSSCDQGWKLFNGHCYLVVYRGQRRDDASAFCENMTSYLMEITTDEELEFVGGLVSRSMFWIGATNREQHRYVYEHSQQQVPDKYWGRGEPDHFYGEHCAYTCPFFEDGNLKLCDDNCRVYAYSVCEKP